METNETISSDRYLQHDKNGKAVKYTTALNSAQGTSAVACGGVSTWRR
jgi:hypothetical protein